MIKVFLGLTVELRGGVAPFIMNLDPRWRRMVNIMPRSLYALDKAHGTL
jgi:hypothetical protein